MTAGRAARAVRAVLGAGAWEVAPLGGTTGRTYVARGPGNVVVRLDADPAVAERLAQLGVAPALVGAGSDDGGAFVVQELVAGSAVSPGWIATHVDEVARLVRTYATDPALAALAVPLPAARYAAELARRTRSAVLPDAAASLADGLVATAPEEQHPGPSHGDPNASNFLLTGDDRLLLVDWDDLRRADRLRDLSQVAWWYLPPTDWPRLLAGAGVEWNETTNASIHWWAAAESLDVALRLLPDDETGAAGFLVDFEAAARGEPNPRRQAAERR